MKKIIILLITTFNLQAYGNSRPAHKIQDQVVCDMENTLGIESLDIKTATKKVVGKDSVGYNIFEIDHPGSIKINFQNGRTEVLYPKTGTGGTFNNIKYPSSFFSQTDAKKITYVMFKSRRLGKIQIAFKCNARSSTYCNGRSSDYPDAPNALFMANINGVILKSNGDQLPICSRRVLR